MTLSPLENRSGCERRRGVMSRYLCLIASLGLSAGAYLPTTSTPGATSPTRRAATAQMVTTKEVFSSYLDGVPSVQKTMTTVPTPVANGALASVVAATAAVGFVLTPSSRIVVNGVGGAIGGAIALPFRKRLVGERKKAAIPAVAALLSDGLGAVTTDSLSTISKDYGVAKDEFQLQLSELYLAYLDACFASSTVETAELSELLRLQKVLGLSAAQVGNKIYAAGRNLYSRHRAYLEEEEDNESKQLLGKYVFLAERILSGDASEEGYRYETMRVQKLFNILASEWKAKAEKAAEPFYLKALRSAVIDAKPVTSEQLSAVRASLGISDGLASGMHTEMFGVLAADLLQPDQGEAAKLTDADSERLGQARLGSILLCTLA